jgi:hypothetical protein
MRRIRLVVDVHDGVVPNRRRPLWKLDAPTTVAERIPEVADRHHRLEPSGFIDGPVRPVGACRDEHDRRDRMPALELELASHADPHRADSD